MKAYIAAPLFCDAEKGFNLHVDAAVRALGPDTFLPQRDGGEAAPLVRQGLDEDTIRRRLYELDCTAIAECAIFVFILDGRVPDEGGCVELGMAAPAVRTASACRPIRAASAAPTPTT
ncbi:nucleoside 2-deoxyribosyltransferase [Saccharopolyspora hirsuta]